MVSVEGKLAVVKHLLVNFRYQSEAYPPSQAKLRRTDCRHASSSH